MLLFNPNENYTTAQVARIVKCSAATLRQLRYFKQGAKYFKIGKHKQSRVLYNGGDLNEYYSSEESKEDIGILRGSSQLHSNFQESNGRATPESFDGET